MPVRASHRVVYLPGRERPMMTLSLRNWARKRASQRDTTRPRPLSVAPARSASSSHALIVWLRRLTFRSVLLVTTRRPRTHFVARCAAFSSLCWPLTSSSLCYRIWDGSPCTGRRAYHGADAASSSPSEPGVTPGSRRRSRRTRLACQLSQGC